MTPAILACFWILPQFPWALAALLDLVLLPCPGMSFSPFPLGDSLSPFKTQSPAFWGAFLDLQVELDTSSELPHILAILCPGSDLSLLMRIFMCLSSFPHHVCLGCRGLIHDRIPKLSTMPGTVGTLDIFVVYERGGRLTDLGGSYREWDMISVLFSNPLLCRALHDNWRY